MSTFWKVRSCCSFAIHLHTSAAGFISTARYNWRPNFFPLDFRRFLHPAEDSSLLARELSRKSPQFCGRSDVFSSHGRSLSSGGTRLISGYRGVPLLRLGERKREKLTPRREWTPWICYLLLVSSSKDKFFCGEPGHEHFCWLFIPLSLC